jgi:hypothetical protein
MLVTEHLAQSGHGTGAHAARYVVVANPHSRRVLLFQQALHRCGLPAASVISWQDAIGGKVAWDRVLSPNTILRIDSPGENFETEKALLSEGYDVEDNNRYTSRLDPQTIASLQEDKGRIRNLRQWFLGFSKVLTRLEQQWCLLPHLYRTHTAVDTLAMFDKVVCHSRLSDAGIPVPRSLGRIRCFDELISAMDNAGMQRVFIKLAHGSSASGVVAFERSRGVAQAFTTAKLINTDGVTRLYNVKKVRRYNSDLEIALIVNALAQEGIHVEQWVPKESVRGQRFDLRVLTIGGRACHTVSRLSSTTITNLRIGNERGSLDDVRSRMRDDDWLKLMRTCERAAAAFPGCLHAGLDVIISTGFKRHVVAEVNAFGDLLPDLLLDGMDSYETQIRHLLRCHNVAGAP